MVRNILVRTYFRNDLFLLKPFYKFYKDIWNPKTFVFFIGFSEGNIEDIVETINNQMKIEIKFFSNGKTLSKYIENTKIYKHEEKYFVIYETTKLTYQNIWDNIMRSFLLKMNDFVSLKDYDFYINTDNDDFFYTKNPDKILNEKVVFKTHTLEMIPQKEFEISNDMMFISHGYFFRMKGSFVNTNNKLSYKNSHSYCRNLFLKEPFKNECHFIKNDDNCHLFDHLRNWDFEELDNVCFAFGCPDFRYLLKTKPFLQSNVQRITGKHINKHNFSQTEIKDHFQKFYTLTDDEMKNNIIINCNALKKYFV
tara:strand:- start:2490 stop:3416 length:927 start_codon:yes stop_codon:yes gene_type:complete